MALSVPAMAQLLGDLVSAAVAVDDLVVQLVLDLRHPAATKLMTSVTGLGSASASVVFLGLFYLAGWTDEFATLGVALPLAGAVVGTLMLAVQRPFPPDPVCVRAGTTAVAHSFPSGHAAVAAIHALVARRSRRLPVRIVAALAALVAVSRIYLGTHYLSDTVVGVLIGAAAVAAARHVLARRRVPDCGA